MEEYKKKRKDAILMAVILILSLIVLFVVIPNQISMSKKVAAQSFTPATFPKILTQGISLFSGMGCVLYTVSALKLKKEYAAEIAEDKEKRAAEKAEMSKKPFKEKIVPFVPYITYLLILAYALIFNYVGFIWATVIIPPIMLFFLGSRKWQHYVSVYAFCGIMYAVFKLILKVPIK